MYVNLYLASTLRRPERGLVIEQTSAYPAEGVRTLTFREGSGALDRRLRVPCWAMTAGLFTTAERDRVVAAATATDLPR
ncbi:glycoside hydrolase family 127 protein [Streptomyces sp. NBC_00377]|uniref:hypothetical protein n=1 Tax=unclassified Streptomyces TaxID=2593676 RepID=UPI002E1F83F0|nr:MULTISPECIES: hypothetical protein [unclassified Streptomyces]